eukprot:gene8586-411_t
MTKVCVTGANGFIALHVIIQLLEKKYHVNATVRNFSNKNKLKFLHSIQQQFPEKLTLFEADLLDINSFDKVIEGCDYVLHLASPVIAAEKIQDSEKEIISPAIKGTENVLKSVLKYKKNIKKIVITSSIASVCSPISVKNNSIITETDWNTTSTLEEHFGNYRIGKTKAEKYATKFCHDNDINMISINPGLVIGEILHSDFELNFSSEVVLKLLNGSKKQVNQSILGFVDVKDVAKAHINAMENEHVCEGRFILCQQSMKMSDFSKKLKYLYPSYDIPCEVDEKKFPIYSIDGSKCSKILKVEYTSLETSIKETVDSFKSVMSLCFGDPLTEEEKEYKKQDGKASKDLRKFDQEDQEQLKILLLGAGASGKSTIFKQMKILNMNGYTEKEKSDYRPLIHRNCYEIFSLMYEFCQDQVTKGDENSENFKIEQKHDRIIKLINDTMDETQSPKLTKDMVDDLLALFECNAFKSAFLRRNEFNLYESTEHYIGRLKEIADDKYVPSLEDILRSRSKTVGIVEQKFTLDDNNILMVDVGGQRNERRKWIHAFDGVSFVIFIASLSEYDQVCDEDPETDRMTESINLFRDICKDKGFKKKPFILFLNKLDMFKEKIKKVDLKVCPTFENYTGGCHEENAYNAIKEEFLAQSKGRKRKIIAKPTTATDTTLVQQVFDQAFALVLEEALGDLKG